MSKQGKSRKSLIVGIIAAVVVLGVLLALLLTQCNTGSAKPDGSEATTVPAATGQSDVVVENADLYWNVDRALYDGKSEGGMSSRPIGEDGLFHVRFFKDGQIIELRVINRALVNKIEVNDLMGLVFDEDGIVVDMIPLDNMPVERIGWKFYVQSVGGNVIKVNSSDKFNGMEVLLEKGPDTKVYDMTGTTGEIGCEAEAVQNDRVMGITDLNGNLKTVYIYDRTKMLVKFDAYCQHCEAEVTWQEWKTENALPTETGHYKIVTDIQLKGQQSMKSDAKICLDLNSHKVDGANGARMYSVHNLNCELAIMDTSEEQKGVMAAHGEINAQGAIVLVRYGAFYLYSGTLDASDAVVIHTSGSSTVYVAAQRFFYMNGGEIIGGKTKYTYNEKTGKYVGSVGGSIVVKGKMVMNDGVIRDGQALSVSYMKNGKRTYERGIGGNIFLTSGSVFEMNGGTIKNGKAGTGGNIFADGSAEITINDGVISGGRALDPGRNAGNVYVGAKATMVMNGGSISGGSTKNLSGNIHLLGAFTMNGGTVSGGKCLDATTGKLKVGVATHNMYVGNGATFAMFGGNINGGVYAIDSSTTDGKSTRVVLSGYATIDKASEGNPNLTIAPGSEPVKVTVGTLRDRAIIGITASGIFSLKTKAENLDNFRSDVKDAEVLYYNECLAVGKLDCLCGKDAHYGKCDGTELLWGPWTSNNSLPTSAGNYYLIHDVNRTAASSLGKVDGEKFLTNLDLNGKTVTSQDRIYLVYSDLNITDHAGGGVLMGGAPRNNTDHTGSILMAGNSVVSLYSGTVAVRSGHNISTTGGVFGVAATATLNVYGGTIDGSNAESTRTTTVEHEATETEEAWTETVTETVTVGKGGAIRLTGTMNMYGGKVIGGKVTTSGGAIYCEKSAKLNIHGGTIQGGKAVQGGSVYLDGNSVMNLAGGTVTSGTTIPNAKGAVDSSNGGNIYAVKSATLNISGGTLEKGHAANGGGNVYSGGKLTISGGKVTGGQCDAASQPYSLNLMLINADTHISGGVIEGYVAVANTVANGSTVKLSGKPYIAGGKYNLRLAKAGEANRPEVIIEGVLEEGSLVYVNETGVISGVTVEENVKAIKHNDSFYGTILNEDSKIAIGYIHCLCGRETHEAWCDGKALLWQPWDGSTSITTSGNYYLTKDVTGGQKTIGSSSKSDTVINLDLFGKTYTGTGRFANVYGGLNIVDSVGGGQILTKGPKNDQAGAMLVFGNAKVNLYQGTIAIAEDHNPMTYGGAIGIAAKGEMNIYADGVVDASKVTITNTSKNARAGAIRVSGKLNVCGGTVIGGNVDIGGAISVEGGGELVVSAGTIRDGNAITGGNIYVKTNGKVTHSGGTICDGTATNGGNVYMEPTSLFTICGGTVSGGEGSKGGSITVDANAELVMTSGLITKGNASGGSGGNIMLYTGGKATVTGGTISDGSAKNSGGNIHLAATEEAGDPEALFILGGDAKVEGGTNTTAGKHGGSINVLKGATFVLEGNATVSDGHSKGGGGNFYVVGTLTIRDNAVITGGSTEGSSMHYGANIYLAGSSVLNLEGGEVEGYISSVNQGTSVINLSGSPKVNKGDTNLRLTYTGTGITTYAQINIVGELTGEAMIGIRMEDKAGYRIDDVKYTGCFIKTENGAAESYEKFFYADAPEGAQIVFMEDGLNVHGEGYRVACACGGRLAGSAYHTCEEKTWKPWKTADKLPTEGYYYLNTDITCTTEYSLTGVNADRTLAIDLNGHDIAPAAGKRIFRLYDNNVTDNTYNFTLTITDNGDGTGKLIPNATMKDQGAAIWITEKTQTVNIFGGTVDGSASTVTNKNPGGLICVGRGTLNIYGGTIKGVTYKNTEGDSLGAAIAITNNHNGGTVNMYGGSVVGGSADLGDAVHIADKNAKFNVFGGSVTGSVYAAGSGLTVGGSAQLELVELDKDVTLIVHESFDPATASVNVRMAQPGIFANNVAVDVSKAFTSVDTAYGVRYNADKTLEIYKLHIHCWCVGAEVLPEGHVCEESLIWTSIPSSAANPFVAVDGGHYHLDWEGNVAKKIEVPDNATVYLCLNGASIRAGNVITTGENSKIIICDCSEGQTGVITTTLDSPLILDQNATAILMSGTISGAYGSAASRITVKVPAGGTFEMYGGKLMNGCSNPDATNQEPTGDRGGNLTIDGTAKLMGGTISGGIFKGNRDVTTYGGSDVTLGGKIKIGYMMVSKITLKVVEKDFDGDIGINMADPTKPIANVTTDVSGCFHSINADYPEIVWEDGALYLTKFHQHCFCIGAEVLPEGHTCTADQKWVAVESTPGTPQTLADGGFYYLDWTGSSAQPLVIPSNATAYICLNGATIKASSTIQLGENSKVVICDCSKDQTGVITTMANTPLTVDQNATAILMSGTINGANGTVASRITVKVSSGATFEMYGGKLADGCLNMSSVTDTTKKEDGSRGGNLTVDGTVKLMGGTITGGKYGSSNRDVTVFAGAGSHCTVGGKIKVGYMKVAGGGILHVVEKDMAAEIGIDMTTVTDPIANVTTDVSGSFRSINATYTKVVWKNGALYLAKEHKHCFCVGAEALPEGHKCDAQIVWTAVEKSTGSSTTLENGGHYYLNWTGSSAQSIVVADKATAYLCLNGATIYATQAITVGTGSTLFICDCSAEKTGMIAVSGASTSAPITMNSGMKVVNLMSGTINGTYAGNQKVAVSLSGGTPTFNMYGGTIKGGYGTGNGGNVTLTSANATFNMFGGTITGGTVASGKHGGNVLITKGHFVMHGGLITGGEATGGKGGNVMLLGSSNSGLEITFTMNGGRITNGNAKNGGNVCVNALTGGTATFIMNGGEISGGIVAENGSNLFVNGSRDTATIKGGTIVGGKDTVYNNGGNLTMP